jgi:chromosome segregation ATPase
MNKIFKYIIGFTLIFPLLILFYACMESSNHKQQYAKDTERVTKLVEALENNTTNIKSNITLEEALKLVSDDSELSSVKKEIQHLKDTYKTDYENKFSDLSNRVFKVESKLNTQIEKIKEEKERQEREEREEREKQKKLKEEAEKKSKESEKKSNEENRKVDLDAFYNAIQEGVDKVNTQLGANMLEMEKTSVTPGIRIILTENNASYSNKELRAIISALNKSLYKIAKSHGVNSPRFYYTLSGEEVAVNRYVMAPDEVKFSGILK